MSGQRVQPGLPSRNTHRVEIDAFCLILERADVMFLSSPETTDSQKAFFFFHVLRQKLRRCLLVESAGTDGEVSLPSAEVLSGICPCDRGGREVYPL